MCHWKKRQSRVPKPHSDARETVWPARLEFWRVLSAIALFPPVVEMSFLSGISMLLGAVWILAYNVGLLRRLRAPAALWRLSTAYVASNRFRTGLTLAMFALVEPLLANVQ